jgi:hypothetical protein
VGRLKTLRDSWKALSWVEKIEVLTVAMWSGVILFGVIVNAEPVLIYISLGGLVVLLSVIVILTIAFQKKQ